MKKKFLFLLLTFVAIFFGCKNDDDGNPVSINGTWNLIHVGGGLAGVDVDYEEGVIVWNFQNGTLIVENNNTVEQFDYLDSGIYSYVLELNSDPQTLTIMTNEMEIYSLSKNRMVFGEIATDGFGYELVR